MDDNEFKATIRFTAEAEKDSYIELRRKLVKLLYIIEDEINGKPDSNAELFMYGFLSDLISNNALCNNRLNDVIIKIHSLYHENGYKNMTHAQIKRKIMESRGIVDHLIKEMDTMSK